LYSLANYAFLYCFELRRHNALTKKKKHTDINWVFIYGQVLTIVIVPLVFLIFWKIKNRTRPCWMKLTTSLIPLLVILSLILTSGRIRYDMNYLSTYLMEV